MLEMVRGCLVTDAEKLNENYQITDYGLIANVNANKIEEIIKCFITMQNDRLFFILELPSSEQDERRLRRKDNKHIHKNIYYIDGMTSEQSLSLLNQYGELLINDGMCQFGFASHDGLAELMLNKYNIINVYTKESDLYKAFLNLMTLNAQIIL